MHQAPEAALCSAPWRTHAKSIFDSSRLQPTCTEHTKPDRKSDIRTAQCIWSVLHSAMFSTPHMPSFQDVFYEAEGRLKLNDELYFYSHHINMLFPLNPSRFNVIWLKNEWLPFLSLLQNTKKIQLNLKPGCLAAVCHTTRCHSASGVSLVCNGTPFKGRTLSEYKKPNLKLSLQKCAKVVAVNHTPELWFHCSSVEFILATHLLQTNRSCIYSHTSHSLH